MDTGALAHYNDQRAHPLPKLFVDVMNTLKNEPTKDRLSRWLAILGLVIAALSLLVSYFSFSSARTSHDEDRLIQLRDKQSAQMNRVVRLLSEYHSLGFLYFFEEVASKRPDYHGDRDTRHAEYHRIAAEMESELLTLPFFWGDCVRNRSEGLQTYLMNYQWESIIQSPDITEKLQGDSDITSGISRELFVEQYEYFFSRLRQAMAAELGAKLKGGTRSSNIEHSTICQDVRVPVEIEASTDRIRMNEPVTFSPKVAKSDSYTTYHWLSGESRESYKRELIVSFSTSGKKTVNLGVYFWDSPKAGEPMISKGVTFKHLVVSVE